MTSINVGPIVSYLELKEEVVDDKIERLTAALSIYTEWRKDLVKVREFLIRFKQESEAGLKSSQPKDLKEAYKGFTSKTEQK